MTSERSFELADSPTRDLALIAREPSATSTVAPGLVRARVHEPAGNSILNLGRRTRVNQLLIYVLHNYLTGLLIHAPNLMIPSHRGTAGCPRPPFSGLPRALRTFERPPGLNGLAGHGAILSCKQLLLLNLMYL